MYAAKVRAAGAIIVLFAALTACASSDDADTITTAAPTSSTAPTTAVTDDEPSGGAAPDDPALVRLAVQAGVEDPTTIVAPPADDPTAAADWYRGDGSAAVTLVTATEPLWRDGADACGDVAVALGDAATPEETLTATTDGPDDISNQILTGLHTLTVEAFAVCESPEEFDVAVTEFAWQWSVAAARLDELEVPR